MSHTLCLSEGSNRLLNIWQLEMTPYLKDSNAYGNIYFARYFEWQGLCREKWFSECICPNMFELEGSLITKSAYNDYFASVVPFQKIRCLLSTRNIKSASFELVFRFYDSDSNQLLSKGGQKIALIGQKSKKLVRFPSDLLEKVRYYANDDKV
ncbi:MAG: thioesterase family protein [Gammaproteobacteria bacterium]|nr:thioesterase family protein [Gammaproteobacteria bacterium]